LLYLKKQDGRSAAEQQGGSSRAREQKYPVSAATTYDGR
jgi:hypothetical protein